MSTATGVGAAQMRLRFLGFAVIRVVAFFLLWLLLVDTVDEQNLVTGGVCALIAAALATGMRSRASVGAWITPRMLHFVYRPFKLLVSDTARVTWALFARLVLRRPILGRLRAVRYDAVGDEPADVGRRILTEWGASAGPNRYVIGIDTDRHLLLIHELVPAAGPLDPLELG